MFEEKAEDSDCARGFFGNNFETQNIILVFIVKAKFAWLILFSMYN